MSKPMTMTQKILAKKAGLSEVTAGQILFAKLDLVMGNDITTPVAIKEFEEHGFQSVFDKSKVAIVLDHFTPNKDIKAAQQSKICRDFAKKHAIENFFDVGCMGIEHALLPEKGLVGPGDAVIGADSHTCTYGALGAFSTGVGSTDMAAAMATGMCWFRVPGAIKFNFIGKPDKWVSGKDIILHIIGKISVDGALYKSMEFMGESLKYISMDSRFTMANMAIEAGAKNGIFVCDEITKEYLKDKKSGENYTSYLPDEDAVYDAVYDIDLSEIKPTVSFPSIPDNTQEITGDTGIAIDQVVIGSCTNGRLEDLKIAAEILKGRKVANGVRVIIIPATQKIYLEALALGYITTFIEAGCAVSTPTCGPCLGGHMGILAEGESAVSTTNRNFVGRMGHITSKVYLASPAIAAATAVKGTLCHPDVL